MTTKLHSSLLSATSFYQTNLSCSQPQQHLLSEPSLQPRIRFDVHRQLGQEGDDGEGQERMSSLFAMRRNDTVIPPQIPCRDSVQFQLELRIRVRTFELTLYPLTSFMIACHPPALNAVRCRP